MVTNDLGITVERLVALHPRLYHMAAPSSWPLIQRLGLLSTRTLLDQFQVPAGRRAQLESSHRPRIETIEHPELGAAEIRDQKPMSDSKLARALRGGLTPQDWYRILNRRVFFWVRRERLEGLLKARAYRDTRQTVLTIDTRPLLDRYAAKVELCPINSGSTAYSPAPRGRDTFAPLSEYPFEHWRRKRGPSKAIVELTVLDGVPDIRDFVLHVEHRGGGLGTEVLFTRDGSI